METIKIPQIKVSYPRSINIRDLGKQRRPRGNSGQVGTDSKLRRLEKNRESARESRKRKKNYISSLESRVEGLTSEVDRLRSIV